MRAFAFAAAVAAATLGFTAAGAQAETMTFKSVLSGPAETPPNDTKGSGTLTATYDTGTKTLAWMVDYSGLTGAAVAAHFHGPAPAGKAAPVEVPLQAPLDSPMKGSAVLTDTQAKDLMDGMMYFNIHTAANKGGEIRGQLEKAM